MSDVIKDFVNACHITWVLPWGPSQNFKEGMSLACVSYSLAACELFARLYRGPKAPRETFQGLWSAETPVALYDMAQRLNCGTSELKFIDAVYNPDELASLVPRRGHLTQDPVNWDLDVAPDEMVAWILGALQRRSWEAACLTLRHFTSAVCVMPLDGEAGEPGGVVWLFDSHGKISHLETSTVAIGFYIPNGDTDHLIHFVRTHMLPRIYGSNQLSDTMIDVQYFALKNIQ